MLFVVGHHVDNVDSGAGGPQNPEVLYTESDLMDWTDLDVVSSTRVGRGVETEDGPVVALDAVLIARR